MAPSESWRASLNNAQAIWLSSQEGSPTIGVKLQEHLKLAGIPAVNSIQGVEGSLHARPKIGLVGQQEGQEFRLAYRSDADGDAVRLPSPELWSTLADDAGRVSSPPPDSSDNDGHLGKGEIRIYSLGNGRGRSPQRNLKRHYDRSPVKRSNNACRSQSNMRGRSKFRKTGDGVADGNAAGVGVD